jgi:aconitase A
MGGQHSLICPTDRTRRSLHQQVRLNVDWIKPGQDVTVRSTRPDGSVTFTMMARLDTPVEVEYYRNGGILPRALWRLIEGDR